MARYNAKAIENKWQKAWEKAKKPLGVIFDDNANIIGNIFNNEKSTQNMGLVERISRIR